MPKISVVLPVYNAENFITNIIDSIFSQTFKDFELICVNDGSKDKTKSILENYAAQYDNIIVINQENSGTGSAANNGIKHASGKYLVYVEHDDSLASNEAFSILYNKAEENDLDIVSFNCSTEKKPSKSGQPSNQLMTGKEFLLGPYHPAAWSRFYKMEYLDKINFRFREDLRFIDTESYPRIMKDAKRVMHIDDVLYDFRIRTNKDSVSDTIMNIGSAKAFYETALVYNNIAIDSNEAKLTNSMEKERLKNSITAARILGSLDTQQSNDIYKLLLALNFSRFEKTLVKNEYEFFYYKNIKKDVKIKHPLIYLIRKVRKLLI